MCRVAWGRFCWAGCCVSDVLSHALRDGGLHPSLSSHLAIRQRLVASHIVDNHALGPVQPQMLVVLDDLAHIGDDAG